MKVGFDVGHLLTNQFKLNYRIFGEGTPILVIGSSKYYPRLFSKRLLSIYQFIFLDHKGFAKLLDEEGKLEQADFTLESIVEDIEKVRAKLELERCILVGHSGHAFMAMEYAKKYPEHVTKLALLNTAPSNSEERQGESINYFHQTASPERKKAFESDLSQLEGDFTKEPAKRFVHLNIRMRAQSFYDFNFDPVYLWQDVQTNMEVIDYLWGEAFARVNLIDSIKELGIPIFLGLGQYDYLVSPVSLWDVIDDRYPHVRKVIFPYSGHNPMFEEPELFDQEFRNWIET